MGNIKKTANDKKAWSSSRWFNFLLIIAIIGLIAFPLLTLSGSEFGGTDAAASQAITQLKPDFVQWNKPLWEPPGGEIQTLLFSLQAAIGAGVIGYFFGLKQGEKRQNKKQIDPQDGPNPDHKG